METTTIPTPVPETKTFEQLWAIVQETITIQKETARRMEETDRRMKETDRQIGSLGNRFGEMVEHMVLPNLIAKFKELGFVFTKATSGRVIEDLNRKHLAEVDIVLEDGDKTMIVEVKSKPGVEDIKEHIKRMEKIRINSGTIEKNHKYLGAVAGIVFAKNVKEYAFKNGFYVVVPSGESFQIHVPEEPYSVKEW